MTVKPSTKFFLDHADDLKKVTALQLIPERFEWEKESVSDLSPGRVEQEIVCRQIHSPLYYNPEKRELTPSAFDDTGNKGFSVDRTVYATRDEIIDRGTSRADEYNALNVGKPGRTLIGLAHLETLDVRAHVCESGLQAFGIYDTARPDNLSHADICLIGANSKKERHRARAHLFEKVQFELIQTNSMPE